MAHRHEAYLDTESELVVVHGTDFGYFWAAQGADGSFYDTAGHTAYMQVRATPESETALATYTTATGELLVGQTVTDGDGVTYTGCIQINLSHTDTAALPGKLVAGYDLILITPTGKRIPWASQRFCVVDSYTEVPS